MGGNGGFRLIDVSSENDSLISPDASFLLEITISLQMCNVASNGCSLREVHIWSTTLVLPAGSDKTQVVPRSFELTGDLGANEVDNMPLTNGHSEQLPRLLETSETESLRTGKCNLRKSLAWDSTFVQNPGSNGQLPLTGDPPINY